MYHLTILQFFHQTLYPIFETYIRNIAYIGGQNEYILLYIVYQSLFPMFPQEPNYKP